MPITNSRMRLTACSSRRTDCSRGTVDSHASSRLPCKETPAADPSLQWCARQVKGWRQVAMSIMYATCR